MKKTVAAGVASLAFAALPVVGAFATAATPITITDQLEVKILTACTFGRWGVEGATGQTNVSAGPTWTGGATADPGNTTTGKYSATVTPGATVELGTSTFKGYCNSPTGFDVTVVTNNLVSTSNSSDTINYSATTPSGADGWTLKLSDNSLFANTTGAKFMTESGPTSTAVTETATYTVYTTATTNSGIYRGDVVYSFTYDDPAA